MESELEFYIEKRMLTLDEAKRLKNAIKESSDISAYSIREWLRCNHVFVATNKNGKLLGACMNDDFHKEWTEIAVLFIFKEYRNKKIGKELFYHSLNDIQCRKKNILILTRNAVIEKLIRESDFNVILDLKRNKYLNKKNKFIVNIYYNIRWFFNLYRIIERIRKFMIFGLQEKFIYGLKVIN